MSFTIWRLNNDKAFNMCKPIQWKAIVITTHKHCQSGLHVLKRQTSINHLHWRTYSPVVLPDHYPSHTSWTVLPVRCRHGGKLRNWPSRTWDRSDSSRNHVQLTIRLNAAATSGRSSLLQEPRSPTWPTRLRCAQLRVCPPRQPPLVNRETDRWIIIIIIITYSEMNYCNLNW